MMQTPRLPNFLLGMTFYIVCSLICSDAKSQAPNWDSVYADFLMKYSPVDTPAWLFPICFKDGTGAWDTVYIAHDPSSTGMPFDAIFGERWESIDTLVFNVAHAFNSSSDPDSALKYGVIQMMYVPDIAVNFSEIEFLNARMPVTMYWDDSLFYSNSLPFPNLAPLPSARGQYTCGDFNPSYPNCGTVTMIMTDNPDSISWPTPASVSDSVTFLGATAGPLSYMLSPVTISIEPYRSQTHVGITTQTGDTQFEVYPNPSKGILSIHISSGSKHTLRFYDVQGRLVLKYNTSRENVDVAISHLDPGIYFVQVNTEKSSLTHKIILL